MALRLLCTLAKASKPSVTQSFARISCILIRSSSAMCAPQIDGAFVKTEQRDLNICPVHTIYVQHDTATFGMGCFWGAESLFGGTQGVIRTTAGYAAVQEDNPTAADRTEVVEIDYDPATISYNGLLDIFWKNHEYGLTENVKAKYRSVIFYHDDEQKALAEASKVAEQKLCDPEVITTAIECKMEFYTAEDRHQKHHLQTHYDLYESLDLTSIWLQKSYVATKLNGYLAGVGGVEQFKEELSTMGLTPSQTKYCLFHIEKNSGKAVY